MQKLLMVVEISVISLMMMKKIIWYTKPYHEKVKFIINNIYALMVGVIFVYKNIFYETVARFLKQIIFFHS